MTPYLAHALSHSLLLQLIKNESQFQQGPAMWVRKQRQPKPSTGLRRGFYIYDKDWAHSEMFRAFAHLLTNHRWGLIQSHYDTQILIHASRVPQRKAWQRSTTVSLKHAGSPGVLNNPGLIFGIVVLFKMCHIESGKPFLLSLLWKLAFPFNYSDTRRFTGK